MILTLQNYKCPSWNKMYGGVHWTKRQEMAEYAHQSVQEALANVKWTLYQERVKISVTAYLKRTIDPDNVSAKLVIDGLKLMGVIKDDTIKEVESVTTRSVKSKTDYTVIEITPYEGRVEK